MTLSEKIIGFMFVAMACAIIAFLGAVGAIPLVWIAIEEGVLPEGSERAVLYGCAAICYIMSLIGYWQIRRGQGRPSHGKAT